MGSRDTAGIAGFADDLAGAGSVARGGRLTPGPHGVIGDGPVDPLAFLGQLLARYGDAVRYQSRFGPCFLFVHPAHVQAILHNPNYRRASLVKMVLGDGLLASDGSRWRSQRRLMQPDFLPAAIAPFAPLMVRHANDTARRWLSAADAKQPVNISTEMTRLTLRIIVQALFSEELSDVGSAELCAAVTQTVLDLGEISWTIFGTPMQFTPRSTARFSAARRVIDAACHDMIARRKADAPGCRPRDLLTLLIQANTDGRPLSDRELRDEMVTMLVGGHETTALALAWAWKLLAEHSDAESRLHEELDAALGGRPPRLADLANLPWTRAVFQESMRLYPPVWYMARVAGDDDVVDGHSIPRGACVMISAWFTHRHAAFWDQPERFDPRRFLNPAGGPRHRYAYFPFGGGRHQCMGNHLAGIEGTLILARLAQQFRIRPLPGLGISPAPGITLRQSPQMQATIELRHVPVALDAGEGGLA